MQQKYIFFNSTNKILKKKEKNIAVFIMGLKVLSIN